jgi:membrane protein YdbS with pleckstrin-like domain
MKKCPFCAEQIQDDAIKCRFCGSMLTPDGGEREILKIHPSFKPILALYLLCAAAAVSAAVLAAEKLGLPESIMIFAAVDVFLSLFVVVFHIRRNSTSYVLSDRNLTVKTGVLGKAATHIPLHKVQDVTVRRTLMDRIFNVGTIVVESAGASGRIPEINVDGPERVCSMILAQVSNAKTG